MKTTISLMAMVLLICASLQAGTPVWINANGVAGAWIGQVAVSPQAPSTLYAVSSGRGVFKSTDSGANWFQPAQSFWANANLVAVDPANPDTLYIALHYSVSKSTDGGVHWKDSSTGLPNQYLRDLEIDPSNPATLYAAVLNSGVYKSTDAGANWASFSNGLANLDLRKLTVDPSNPDVLYIATAGGVYRSYNAGSDWFVQNAGLTSLDANCVAVDPQHPLVLYAGTADGVFKSINGSGSWSHLDGAAFLYATEVAVDPADPTKIYANEYRSTDSGATWTFNNMGGGLVWRLTVDPVNTATIYAAMQATGIMKSTDSGATWTSISGDMHAGVIKGFALNAGAYFAATSDGPFYSTDGGQDWAPAAPQLSSPYMNAIAADPLNPLVAYAGSNNGIAKRGLFDWSTINTGLGNLQVSKIVMDPTNSSTLYAGTYGGVFKSTNATSWATASTGLGNNIIKDMVIDPGNNARIYAGTMSGVYLSTNGAANWGYIGPAAKEVLFLAHDPVAALTLYVGIEDKLYKTTDGGSTWAAPISLGTTGRAMAIPAGQSSTLYVAGWFTVLQSTDGGQTWNQIHNGLPSTQTGFMNSLASDPSNPDGILVGTFDWGIYRLVDASYWDDFSDFNASDWTLSGGGWNITDAVLSATTTKKAKALSPTFPPCASCTLEADLRIDNDAAKVILYGWYQDSKNFVELMLDPAKDKLKLIQKQNGLALWKVKATVSIVPNTIYHIRVSYDGTSLHVLLNNDEKITQGAALSPAGRVTFVVKSSTGGSTGAWIDNLVVY